MPPMSCTGAGLPKPRAIAKCASNYDLLLRPLRLFLQSMIWLFTPLQTL